MGLPSTGWPSLVLAVYTGVRTPGREVVGKGDRRGGNLLLNRRNLMFSGSMCLVPVVRGKQLRSSRLWFLFSGGIYKHNSSFVDRVMISHSFSLTTTVSSILTPPQ